MVTMCPPSANPSAKQSILDWIEEELEKLKTGGASPMTSDSSIKQVGDYDDRVEELTDEFN